MIDEIGQIKLIDFGSTRIAGVAELSSPVDVMDNQGTLLQFARSLNLGVLNHIKIHSALRIWMLSLNDRLIHQRTDNTKANRY
jgi:hypothetical protein